MLAFLFEKILRHQNMIIREATIDDIPAISKLGQRTYAETFGSGMSEQELEDELNSNKSEKYFQDSMINKEQLYLVAEQEGVIIGYIGLRNPDIEFEGRQPTDKDQALDGIYVSSDYHRQGIGRQLMDAAFNHERFLTSEYVYLCVWDENKPAYNFYLNYGFEKVGKKEFIIDGAPVYDLVLMKKT